MRIIAILKKFTVNILLAHMIDAFLKQGHLVDVFAESMAENHIYMFKNIDVNIHPIEELIQEEMEKYDIGLIYATAFRDYHWLTHAKLYMVAYNHSYSDEPICGADLLIERGFGWRPLLPAGKRSECTRLVVGDPKHDETITTGIEEIPNQLLFIDSGHYPYGMEGKNAVADFILAVCKKFPDYQLIVKPRHIKGDISVAHNNPIFLYDVIKSKCLHGLPPNLILLEQHTTLPELIASSHAVIAMYTSAYMDVAVQGRPFIILDHLPCEDRFDVRKESWDYFRQIIVESGCLVDYRDAIQYLPDGIRCSEEHIKKHIYSEGNINLKIVKSIEYIYNNYISQGKYPALGLYYYDHLKDHDISDPNMNFRRLSELRVKNLLYFQERQFYWSTVFYPTDQRITHEIEELEQNGSLNNESIHTLYTKLLDWIMGYAKYIPKNSNSQAQLLSRLGFGNNYRYIYLFKRDQVLNHMSYDFFYGRACYDDQNYEDAEKSFQLYLRAVDCGEEEINAEHFEWNRYLSALFYCGMSAMNLKHYDKAKSIFQRCRKLTNGNHEKAQEMIDQIKLLNEKQ